MTSYFSTVRVDTDKELSTEDVRQLLQRFITAGIQAAADTPDDWHEPDADKISAVTGVAVGLTVQLGAQA